MQPTPNDKLRRGSRAWRLTPSGNSRASPDAEEHRKQREWRAGAWANGPGEERLVVVTAVLELWCAECSRELSRRGMRVQLVADTSTMLFSTDTRPLGVVDLGAVRRVPGQCNCQVQDFACKCGLRVGYRIAAPCIDCTMSQEESNHHWFLSARCVRAEPRRNAQGEMLVWPQTSQEALCSQPTGVWGPVVPPMPSYQSPEDHYDYDHAAPLSDRNGRCMFRASPAKPAATATEAKEATPLAAEFGRREPLFCEKENAARSRESDFCRRQDELEARLAGSQEERRDLERRLEETAAEKEQAEARLRAVEQAAEEAQQMTARSASEALEHTRRAQAEAEAKAAEAQALLRETAALRESLSARDSEAQREAEELRRGLLELRAEVIEEANNKAKLKEELELRHRVEAQRMALEVRLLRETLAAAKEEASKARLEAQAARLAHGGDAGTQVPWMPSLASLATDPLAQETTCGRWLTERREVLARWRQELSSSAAALAAEEQRLTNGWEVPLHHLGPAKVDGSGVPPPPVRPNSASRWGAAAHYYGAQPYFGRRGGLFSWVRRVTGCGRRRTMHAATVGWQAPAAPLW